VSTAGGENIATVRAGERGRLDLARGHRTRGASGGKGSLERLIAAGAEVPVRPVPRTAIRAKNSLFPLHVLKGTPAASSSEASTAALQLPPGTTRKGRGSPSPHGPDPLVQVAGAYWQTVEPYRTAGAGSLRRKRSWPAAVNPVAAAPASLHLVLNDCCARPGRGCLRADRDDTVGGGTRRRRWVRSCAAWPVSAPGRKSPESRPAGYSGPQDSGVGGANLVFGRLSRVPPKKARSRRSPGHLPFSNSGTEHSAAPVG
jgi:hypothetical protein